jgi:hypothetical protein
MVARAEQGGLAALSRVAHMVQAQAMVNASGEARWTNGRPGPRARQGGTGPGVVSGSLRRSIMVDGPTSMGSGEWMMLVGPTMRYSRRLELGFEGADSRGRSFHQPPYPYLKPAFDFVVQTNALGIFTEEFQKALS